MTSDAALLAVIEDTVRRAVREAVAAALDRSADPLLSRFLAAWFAFGGSAPWTAAEALAEARLSSRRDLLAALDVIVGDTADPAKALGRFLQRHADGEAGGYRLNRCRREAGSWVYSVTEVSWE